MVSEKKIVADLVELCYAHGVRNIVLSPGSRNAPFTITFQEDDRFNCFVIPDERAAAFFALGLAQYTKMITAICCTSGSAAINYGPALAEAYYQRIPLLAITADRPEEWINQGVGQSINQHNLYQNYIRKSHTLPSDFNRHQYAARLVNEVLLYANGDIKGPVHLNVPLYEPLYNTTSTQQDKPKVIHKAKLFSKIADEKVKQLAEIWNASSKKLILIGAEEKNETLQKMMNILADDPSVVVLTETHSNLVHQNFHENIDRLLKGVDENNLEEYTPEILLTFGQNVISKHIKLLLRKMDIPEHWHVDAHPDLMDTYYHLTQQVDDHPDGFLKAFTSYVISHNNPTYSQLWMNIEELTQKAHHKFTSIAPYSDFTVFNTLLSNVPSGSYIQMGNSATVRYIQLFPQRKDVVYHGNRGVSGIDGCTSTAMGAAWTNSDHLTVLISGDLSFLYDINGLWHEYISSQVRIIIINNSGGGIFRFIKGPSSTKHLESSFELRQHYSANHIAKTYGLEYYSAESLDSLNQVLPTFFQNDKKASILEIFTPPEVNDKVLKDYFSYLKGYKDY